MKQTNKTKKKMTAAVLIVLGLVYTSMVSAEEMVPAFSQKDLSFSLHTQMGELNKYPVRGGLQEIDGGTGLVQKTSDTCTDPGEKDGDFRCTKSFSNGVKVQMTTDQEHHGEDFKRQVMMAEFNARGEIMARQTVRQKTAYAYVNDEKRTRAEFFDVVSRPRGKKITREVIIYEYNLGTGRAEKISWTSYEQIGDSDYAMITRHVALSYDKDGQPLMGRAEKWKNQVPVEKLFSWDRILDGKSSLDLNSWETWKNQIFNASPRQIF